MSDKTESELESELELDTEEQKFLEFHNSVKDIAINILNLKKLGKYEISEMNQLKEQLKKIESQYINEKVYKCEDCREYKYKHEVLDDGWKKRLKDGVFLCRDCYRCYQIRMDIG